MKVLILGSNGLLGKALVREALFRKYDVFGLDLENADFCIDIRNDFYLKKMILYLKPDLIINTVAIVSIAKCEKEPSLAYEVNSRPVGILSNLSKEIGFYFVHISTDHFFSGDKDKQHKESDSVVLFNEYSRTKYAAECFALTNPNSLIVRTNIVGFRGNRSHTFLEWVINAIEQNEEIILFNDFYTSSIDVKHFSRYLLGLINLKPRGIINLAGSDVANKKTFISLLAALLGSDLSNAREGSIALLDGVTRAESLGLDVSRAESLLGQKLPNLEQVLNSIVLEYKENKNAL